TGNLTVYTYTKISSIHTDPETGQVESLETDFGTIYTNKVINCAGAWSPEIGAFVGVDIPVYPRKGTILVSEKTKKLCFHKIFEYGYVASVHPDINYKRLIDEDGEKYNVAFNIEYTNDDNILIGGNRTFSGDTRTELKVIQAIARRGIRFFPQLKDVHCIRSYAGIRPFTKDLKPIMSSVPSVPGFYVCTGHEGSGILSCAACGRIMAQLVNNEKTDYDMEEFSITRFEQAS
ncbi:MAG: NAD(P)/FAD-dependent oxidoreductase, partial [Lachnospiraceae bacterium]